MNRGFLLKAVYETWAATLLCGVLLAGVEGILAYVMQNFQSQFSEVIGQLRFVQTFVTALLGIKAADQLGPEAFVAFPWVHPVVLALIWTHALVWCTRMPAGEIDRGTIDATLTLPVTRWCVLRSETLAWIAAGLVVLLMGLAGNLVGASFSETGRQVGLSRLLTVLANLFCLYLAVGGLAWLVSASSNRRGIALTIVVMLLLAFFLLNYLAQFWKVAESISFLGVFDYYRPFYILRDGTIPWRDMAVLVGSGIVTWTAAGIVLSRRDICTV